MPQSKHPVRTLGAKEKKLADRIRKIIGDWPEIDERISHGMPTWWGGKKTFARFAAQHHNDERIALWFKSDLDSQEELVAANPRIFFVPPYVGVSGWVGADLGASKKKDWELIEVLLEKGYRSVAPKRAITQLDMRER